jgi:hypothetical protein
MERIWKEGIMAQFEVPARNLPTDAEILKATSPEFAYRCRNIKSNINQEHFANIELVASEKSEIMNHTVLQLLQLFTIGHLWPE